MKLLRHILLCCLLAFAAGGRAQQDTLRLDSLRASLLTITPGQDSYSLYGHTALRISNAGSLDFVFNYGAFSPDAENFLWKFALGRTDYTLVVERTKDVMMWYTAEGRYVIEQHLDMRPEEVRRLFDAMRRDATTPGWTYRYTFLTDNCATRPVGLLEDALGTTLQWREDTPQATFRQLIHRHVLPRHAWSSFGQDMLLGAALDTLVEQRAHVAFPMELLRMMETAEARMTDGSTRRLVLRTDTLNAELMRAMNIETEAENAWAERLTSPLALASLLLLLLALASLLQLRRRPCMAVVTDTAWMGVQTLVGLVVWFEFLFSSLPGVGSNCLALLFTPLPLVAWGAGWLKRKWGGRSFYMACVQLVMTLAFTLAWGITGQDVPPAIAVLALSLLIRSLTELHCRRNGFTTKQTKTR
ncbi:MAG: DUF4105 domain-containing protein [Bacteroidales bacterium]|nr:DUF4105 domain-containing protein [Bacteroidales bacterium]